MSKYCINCGRYIEDNQTCMCALNHTEQYYPNSDNTGSGKQHNNNYSQANAFQSPQQPVPNLYGKPRNSSEFFNGLLSILLAFVKDPINTVKDVSFGKQLYTSLFFLVLQNIVLCLFTMFYSYKWFGYLNRYLDLSIGYVFRVFFISICVIILQLGLMTLFLKLSTRDTNDFVSSIVTISMLSIPITAALLISFPLILVFLTPFKFLSCFLIFLSVAFSLVVGCDVLKDYLKKVKQSILIYVIISVLAAFHFVTISLAFHMFFF